MTKTMLQHLQDQAADWPEIPEILWAITEITQLRGNLSLAEEGLAAATQEIERLRLLIQTWNDWEETTRMADWFARGQEIERLTKERDVARTVLNNHFELQRAAIEPVPPQRCEYVGMHGAQCGLDAGHEEHRLFGPHRPVLDCGNPVMRDTVVYGPCRQPEGHAGECDPPPEKSGDGQ